MAGDHPHANDAPADGSPLKRIHAHFCGIHIAKADPNLQLVTQHYCAPRDDEMHQCLLYDSHRTDAKLLGVEYIISDRLYRELPQEERKFWHAHTYEVLAGGLIAPGLDEEDERAFMKSILTTWGKAWHTWPDPTTRVPLGEPMLIWSLMGDGQVRPDVVAERDRQFGVRTDRIRDRRVKELGYQVPQVPPPGSMQEVGRQWTIAGEDVPSR